MVLVCARAALFDDWSRSVGLVDWFRVLSSKGYFECTYLKTRSKIKEFLCVFPFFHSNLLTTFDFWWCECACVCVCVCVCMYVCMLHRESTFHLTDDDNNINKSFAVFSALCDHLAGWLGLRPFIYFISIIGRSLRLRRPVGLPVHCLLYCLPIRNPRKRREYLINI